MPVAMRMSSVAVLVVVALVVPVLMSVVVPVPMGVLVLVPGGRVVAAIEHGAHDGTTGGQSKPDRDVARTARRAGAGSPRRGRSATPSERILVCTNSHESGGVPMLQLTHSSTPARVVAPPRRSTVVASPRAEAPAAPLRSDAAPLTLAAVVIGGELLAVTIAIAGVLGA
jgi:hypothetical protein